MPCRAHEMKEPIFGTVLERGWINGNSVGLDPEKMRFGMSQRLVDENELHN